jgi:hypothetical protein
MPGCPSLSILITIAQLPCGWVNTTCLKAKLPREVWTDSPQAVPPKTQTRLNYSNWMGSPKAYQLARCPPCRDCHPLPPELWVSHRGTMWLQAFISYVEVES